MYNTIQLSVVKILTTKDLFIKPVPSRHVGIYLINTNCISSPYNITLNTIKFKCFFSQLVNNQAVVISLCHNV